MHIHNNSVLHYLYDMAVDLVIYSKARAFNAKAKTKAKSSRARPMPRPENRKAKAKKLALRPRPRPRMNIRGLYCADGHKAESRKQRYSNY